MKLNFFNPKCQEPPRSNEKFGICDDKSKSVAYTTISQPENWIAIVENTKREILTFTAIDKCVLNDRDEPGRGRCDGMLTSEKHLYLVELKDRKDKSAKEGIEQIKSTIQFLKDNHEEVFTTYQHRKAFVCNRKKGWFTVLDDDDQLKFFRKYKFRLDIQTKIVVV